MFLLVITERMHLKVREIYGKHLIFWEMETGLLSHCCCSAPSLVFFVLCLDLCLIADTKSKKLEDDKATKVFRTFVLMKGMFLCKRGRQAIQSGIMFLQPELLNEMKAIG